MIQYWFRYVFNDFANRHESDWEHVSIYVLPERRKGRRGHSISERDDGLLVTRLRPEVRLGRHPRLGVRAKSLPVVFVAKGSHATTSRRRKSVSVSHRSATSPRGAA
jgi:hypothetical protein